MEKTKTPTPGTSLHSLPESLLLAIFSRVHSAKAISRAAAVCSQWRRLCRSVESLTFSSVELCGKTDISDGENVLLSQKLAAFILQTLRNTQYRCLKRLRIIHTRTFGVLSLDVWLAMWLGSLNPSSLEEIELNFFPDDYFEDCPFSLEEEDERAQKSLKEIFLYCNRLQRVHLGYWKMVEWPLSLAPSFQQLLCIDLLQVEISKTALEDLVMSIPRLEFLKLRHCGGFSNPCLVGLNLRVLILHSSHDDMPRIRLVAPKLVKLWAMLVKELNFLVPVDALEMLRVTSSTKIRGVEGLPFLRTLEIWPLPDRCTSKMAHVRHIIGLGKTVKHLNLDMAVAISSNDRDPFRFLEFLPQLETLFIGDHFLECLREHSLHPWVPTGQASLPHLRKVEVKVGEFHDPLKDIVDAILIVLHGLLVRLGEVKDLELALCIEENFVEKMLQLQKTFPYLKITFCGCPSVVILETLENDDTCFTYGN